MERRGASPKRAASKVSSSLPAITSDQDKQVLREELKAEYFKQNTELKKVENKTKALSSQADELRAKLKEKDTLLRIAKFKLSEVQRNIKHNQLKPIVKEDLGSPRVVSDPSDLNKARLAALAAKKQRDEQKAKK